jgi:hypothetical protein
MQACKHHVTRSDITRIHTARNTHAHTRPSHTHTHPSHTAHTCTHHTHCTPQFTRAGHTTHCTHPQVRAHARITSAQRHARSHTGTGAPPRAPVPRLTWPRPGRPASGDGTICGGVPDPRRTLGLAGNGSAGTPRPTIAGTPRSAPRPLQAAAPPRPRPPSFRLRGLPGRPLVPWSPAPPAPASRVGTGPEPRPQPRQAPLAPNQDEAAASPRPCPQTPGAGREPSLVGKRLQEALQGQWHQLCRVDTAVVAMSQMGQPGYGVRKCRDARARPCPCGSTQLCRVLGVRGLSTFPRPLILSFVVSVPMCSPAAVK